MIGAAAIPIFVLSVPFVLRLGLYLVNPHGGAWLAALLVALTAIYAFATVAFGFGYSNLTYRAVRPGWSVTRRSRGG